MRRLGLRAAPTGMPRSARSRHRLRDTFLRVGKVTRHERVTTPDHPASRLDLCRAPPAAAPRVRGPARPCAALPFPLIESMGGPPSSALPSRVSCRVPTYGGPVYSYDYSNRNLFIRVCVCALFGRFGWVARARES